MKQQAQIDAIPAAANTNVIFLNGELVPEHEAKVSVFDHGFLYGDAIFEGLIARDGRIFRLKDHLDRLFRSAKALQLNVGMSAADFERAVYETLKRNNMTDGYVRICVSRGPGFPTMDPRGCKDPTIVIFAQPLQEHPLGKEHVEKPFRAMIASTRRTPPICLDARIKTHNYLNNILARIEATAAGMDEPIMMDINNFVAETAARNIFIVKGGKLRTPKEHNILAGITREVVLELARSNGWPAAEADLTPYDLHTADEVFLSGTMLGIKPVVEVDGYLIGDGHVGPITTTLMEQYESLLLESS